MRSLLFVLLALVACTTSPEVVPTTSAPPPTTTSVPTATTTLPDLGVELCDPADFVIPSLPEGLDAATVNIAAIATDKYTSVPGSAVSLWAGADGEISMAFLRGSLPVEPWAGATERVTVRGFSGALGPLSDGVWAVAWFEAETKCDSYTLLFYPPLGAEEARLVAESIRDR